MVQLDASNIGTDQHTKTMLNAYAVFDYALFLPETN